MLIIIDSGSTKSDWLLINAKGQETRLSSLGFNPVLHSIEFIRKEIEQVIVPQLDAHQTYHIYFYGSGCWDQERKQKVRQALQANFATSYITVYHDLLGAARACCQTEQGVACILGTGSNSCLYNGEEVTDNVSSIGYMLGDEGSGTHLGKKLIRHYFYREMPQDLIAPFEAFIQGGKKEVLDKVYGQADANVYLASLSRFLSEHIDHPFVQRILYRSLSEFIDRHVRKYQGHMQLPIHFVGSIAFIFQDMIKLILAERNMQVGRFIKQPIEALRDYHLKLNKK